MSPILGIYASQMSGHLWPASSYESIATTTVGAGGSAFVTFSSIPSTYTHLQIRVLARDTRAVSFDNLLLQANSDTGSNYSDHFLYGDGSTTLSGGGGSSTEIRTGTITGASATASVFGANVIDILDYANTNKYKTVRALTGADANGSGQMVFRSGLWINTAAITTIKLFPGGGNFGQYSSFALYGIKGV
jgi:hypothetical protein